MTQPRFYIRWIFHDQSLSPGNPSSKMQLLVWPVQRAKGKHLTLEILHSLSAWGWPSVKQDCGSLLIDLLEEKEKTSENGSYTTGLWDVLLLAHLASCVCMLSRFSCVYLYAMLWTAAHQAPLSMGFSRQEYWVGCHFFLEGIFLTQGSNLLSYVYLHWEAGSLPLAPPQNIFAYVLLNRRFEKVSGNVASSKRWFHLINSYFLTLSGVFFQTLVWPEVTSYGTPKEGLVQESRE